MIAASENTLRELSQMRHSATVEWLKVCRLDAMERLANVEDPALRGEIRTLKELIETIETAREKVERLQRPAPQMQKSF